jgi:hypothetical protein
MASLSGCSGILGDELPEETLTPVKVPPTETETATPTPPDGTGDHCDTGDAAYEIDGPPTNNLPEPNEQFDGFGCPTFAWAAKTVCYHTADLLRADVVLVGEKTQAWIQADEDGGDLVSFSLVNRRAELLQIQPSTWSILRRRSGGDGWRPVASGDPGCTQTLHPEQFYRWRLGIERAVDGEGANVMGAQTSLEPAFYMFAIPVFLPDGTDFVCAAPFRVQTFEFEETPTLTPVEDMQGPGPLHPNATEKDSE